MSELLPILFARGQSEAIDPRLAPPDVHISAQNVRWRTDGRPAKRYGATAISTTGLDSGGSVYSNFAVNFVGSWRDNPIMALGAGVRRLIGPKWSSIAETNARNLPHFGPGRHDPIARSETKQLLNPTTCYANGVVMYAWDDGTSIHYSVTVSGAILVADTIRATGVYPRLVAQGNSIYLLYNASNVLKVAVYDTPTQQFTTTATLAASIDAGSNYDACPRSAADWLLVYVSAGVLVVDRLTGINTVGSTQSITPGATTKDVAIAGTSTANIFVAWIEFAAGAVRFQAFNNGLTASTGGPTTLDTSINNVGQPSIVIDDNTDACVFWGGSISTATPFSRYMSYAPVTAAGTSTGPTTIANVTPRSKPFYGLSAVAAAHDGRFIWVSNYGDGSAHWEDQSTFFLLWINATNTGSASRVALWTPNVSDAPGTDVPGESVNRHMVDVVTDGVTFYTTFTVTLQQSAIVAGTNLGVDAFSFTSILGRMREAARDTVQAGRALQISGGVGYEFNGAVEESGFMYSPVFDSNSAISAGAGLTTGASYFYRAVYEWLDSQGRRHRSAPSDPINMLPSAGNLRATLLISTLAGFARAGTPVIHIYRTLGNGATYQRITTSANAPAADGGSSSSVGFVTFIDSLSDAALIASDAEFIYTDGGVLPNSLAPPYTFSAVCNGRVWVGGLLDRNVITASKLLVDGEPTQFVDQGLFEFDVFLPEECTGLASIDGTVIAFARESIYVVTGDGPDDEGNGSFSPPQRLPSDTGCIDWRSVLETSIGIFYQSKRGIFLLPRGFNTPLFVGADVVSTLATFPIILSATLVTSPSSGPGALGEITARFVVAKDEAGSLTAILVYDLRTQGWSVDQSPTLQSYGLSGTWLDEFVSTIQIGNGVFSALQIESPSTFAENALFISTELSTGDIRPFGVAGYGGFDRVVLMGEFRGGAFVNITVSVDSAPADLYQFTVSAGDQADGTTYLDVTPKIRLGSSIRVAVSDAAIGGVPTEGFIPQALFIEHDTIGKTKRLAAARKA